MRHIMTGQALLIACCIFYLIFWSLGYRPGEEVNRAAGLTGFFLLITALFGFAGVGVCVHGFRHLETVQREVPMGAICAGGVILYFAMMLITRTLMKRPVTTELVLITGWLVLELCVADAMYAGGMKAGRIAAMIAIVLAAWLISMILYVLYYRMDEMKAYYAAMVPLITEAVGMAGVIACILTA